VSYLAVLENKSNTVKASMKNSIINILEKQKPKTIMQLKNNLPPEQAGISQQDLTYLLIELENEGKIKLNKKTAQLSPISSPAASLPLWYWGSMIVTTLLVITVFFPVISYSFPILRAVLGLVFLLFLPGFVLVKAIYPKTVPVKAMSHEIDRIERFVLSIGLSLALISIVGLVLYYTPFGLNEVPLVFVLVILTIILSDIALLNERKK
jgi:hypothetical protein